MATCIEPDCASPADARQLCVKHLYHWRNKNRDKVRKISGSTPDEFWSRVRRGDPEQCWPWLKADGSEATWYGNKLWLGRQQLAHRIAYMLTYGTMPPLLMHSCDNPPCCNPAHLRPGSHKTNALERKERGRGAAGSRHGNAVLTDDQVKEIRKLYDSGERRSKIVEAYGISRSMVYNIGRRTHWIDLGSLDG
jgi:hypothetical protein